MATAEVKESKEKEAAKEIAKEKLKALSLTIEKIEKAYGKGTIMKLGGDAVEQIASISTGSISLDNALGIGGLPVGRVVEIYGPESSGKTTSSAPRDCKRSEAMVELLLLLMRSMHLIVCMPKNLVLTLRIC